MSTAQTASAGTSTSRARTGVHPLDQAAWASLPGPHAHFAQGVGQALRSHRGQGLAATLVRAVAHTIRTRGETPFMHASAANVNAVRLYRSMGFELRREVLFSVLRAAG